MIFRTTLAAAALMMSGAAYAQTPIADSAVERVVVDVAGKSMPVLRIELLRASEAVCRSDSPFGADLDESCVSATYRGALRRAKLARTAMSAPTAPPMAATRVASR